MEFHGIAWKVECANFADTSSFMEFHGNWNAPISLRRTVAWKSEELVVRQFRWHEQFHGIRSASFRWNEQFHGIQWNSMEQGVRQCQWHEQFHGIPWNCMELGVRLFRWHEQFHSIPWNYECASFVDRSSSMEFRGNWSAPISLTQAVSWNSIKFHGTWSAPI